MIDDYPNFEWNPGSPITDDYKNEDDDKYEYEHIDGVQEGIYLEEKVEIHETLEDEYAIKETDKEKYPREDPNVTSGELDDEVEEGDDTTIKYDTGEKDVISDKPSKNEDDE